MLRTYFCLALLCCCFVLQAQEADPRLSALYQELANVRQEESVLLDRIETIKLELLRTDLHAFGLPVLLPGEEIIHHQAFSLVYDEQHEQAKWVAHLLTADIREGNVSRTNDFRPDPLVVSGTAVEQDYFLKYLQEDSSYTYDGFGYDRGHLAPSADFRWSARALSESYLYSNISPQLAEFNREKWAELEGMLRGYLYEHPETQLYVVTGPILNEELPRIERGVNGVSIPKLFFKVALDLKNERAIAFIMPNEAISAPLSAFAVSIDKAEEESGIDFFPGLPDDLEIKLEAIRDYQSWLPPDEVADAEPIHPPSLPRNHFNTVQSRLHMDTGREVTICGTVVSTHVSRKDNVFLNLDQKFPNQLFTVTIWKDNLQNFSYPPAQLFIDQRICVKGKVRNFNGTPSINAEREEQLWLYVGED